MKKIIVSKDIKITHAMKKIAQSGTRCLIIADNSNKLIGTLTDGDIRKAILNGTKLNDTIKSVYNSKPNYLIKDKFSYDDAKKLIVEENFQLLPVVNKSHKIIDYIDWKKIFGEDKIKKIPTNIPLVIMAGGEGKRLKPFTEILPKALIPIGDKAIIERIIDNFFNYGIKNFYISTIHKSRILKSYFFDIKKKYNLSFLNEKKALGTVGGLSHHKKKFNSTIFLSNCDILVNADFSQMLKFHKKNKNDITIIVSTKSYKIPYGICELDDKGKFSSILEKPTNFYLINTGLYIINAKILKYIPKEKFYHMTDLIKNLKKLKKKIGIYPIEESNWVDVGQWPEFQENQKKLNKIK